MSVFDDIRSFEFDRNRKHHFGVTSGIVWGHSKNTNESFPLLYIAKPKHISQEDFELLLDSIDIRFLQ